MASWISAPGSVFFTGNLTAGEKNGAWKNNRGITLTLPTGLAAGSVIYSALRFFKIFFAIVLRR
jgi:hypothetical protein